MIFISLLILCFLLLLLGAPIFAVISGLTLLLFFSGQIDSSAIIIEMYRMATTPVLVAIPLFTFSGYLLSESGATKRLVRLSNAILGWLPGGLSIIALITCATFTALTGATGLTIIALGGILLPAMLKSKYSEKFSLGLLTTSGTLGLLFPPSLPLIVYAIVAKVGIDQLFLAGLLPGFLLVILLSSFASKRPLLRKCPGSGSPVRDVESLGRCGLGAPSSYCCFRRDLQWVFCGERGRCHYSGLCPPVEVVIHRDIHWKELPQITRKSMILVGGLLIILGAALGLTNYLIDEQVPMKVLNFFKAHIVSPYLFLIV